MNNAAANTSAAIVPPTVAPAPAQSPAPEAAPLMFAFTLSPSSVAATAPQFDAPGALSPLPPTFAPPATSPQFTPFIAPPAAARADAVPSAAPPAFSFAATPPLISSNVFPFTFPPTAAPPPSFGFALGSPSRSPKKKTSTKLAAKKTGRRVSSRVGPRAVNFRAPIYEVHKQLGSRVGITKESVALVNAIANDLLEALALEASRLSRYRRDGVVTQLEVEQAVQLLLSGELAAHAQSEGRKSVMKVRADLVPQEDERDP